MYREAIPDEGWHRLAPVLHAIGMRNIRQFRVRLEAVLHRLRTGCPWRDLPSELDAWSTNFNFFNRWSKRGAWKKLFEALRGEIDDEWNFIDSTHVKVHAHGHGARGRNKAEQAIGKSRGGWTSKLHARCDAHGNLIDFVLTTGNVHDCKAAPELLANCRAEAPVGDKGYDSQALRTLIRENGGVDHIPMRKESKDPNAHFDAYLYRLHQLVENFFCRLKVPRALATRYDKLARNFLSLAYVTVAMQAIK